jgi:hypothetical protein|tara:strand:- start:10527 stop:11312 length:786 start_codon:yes stop_codon:yes gene_type:complete
MAQPEFDYTEENFKKFYKDLKETKFIMGDDECDVFLDMLHHKIPFALTRMNDGEMSSFVRPDGQRFGRTQHTVVDENLRERFREVLSHEQKNYWIGLVCSECFPELYEKSKEYVRDDYEYQTRAVVLTNRNWGKFVSTFADAVYGRTLHWVGSHDQNIQMLKDVMGLEFGKITLVPQLDAWKYYDEIKDTHEMYDDGDVVAFSCGPMSRILIKEWYEKRPNVTFMGVGSVFDPFTKNVWHSCHRGWTSKGKCETKSCGRCN